MKANELMIGDWVYNPFIRKAHRMTFGRDLDLVEELCLEPVPLTKDVLEKNGFTDDYDSEYDMSYEFAIQHPQGGMSAEVVLKHNEDDAEWMAYLFGPKGEVEELAINYIHELQHALRLCGVEKEIIL